MAREKWMLKNKAADFKSICRSLGCSELISRLLVNRGLETIEDMRSYLHPDIKNMHEPVLMKDMDKACHIILKKISEGRKIRVVGDYDVDGIVSTYVLVTALKSCGAEVDYRIPDRIKDGYGINIAIIEEAIEAGIDTIVTCDNGISAYDQTEYANEHGITMIITDHHDVPEKIPVAAAVVNPKQKDCTYPFENICGATVAYKLIKRLYELLGRDREEADAYIEYIAIATVCDVMELTDENRIIVSIGLKMLRQTKNPGIMALIVQNKLIPENLGTYHLGFVIGPCLNATGRLESAVKGVELLMTEDRTKAELLAKELKQLNDTRKDMTQAGLERAVHIVESDKSEDKRVLVVYVENCHESLAGIIAGRLRERYYKPVIVLTDGDENVKGSGRSIESYHMFEELTKCSELLLKFGGHPMAAGLSLQKENVEAFSEQLNKNCTLTKEQLTPKVSIDVALKLSGVSEGLIEELDMLEPFGKGNEKPVLADKVTILKAARMGADGRFLRLQVCDSLGLRMDAVYFGDSEMFLDEIELKHGERGVRDLFQGMGNIPVSVIYYPNINEYNGNRKLQIVIQNYSLPD